MKYKAIALDLDGTLTNSEKKVSEKNKETIWKAIDKGVTVILASGRPLFGVKPVADELKLQEKGGYMLACNGGCIIDCKTGNQVYSDMLPKQLYNEVFDIAREHGLSALTYYGDKVISENVNDKYVAEEARCNGAQTMQVDNLNSFVDYEVPKILIVGEHEKLVPIQKILLEKHSDIINSFFSEGYFLEVVPKTVAKDKSLERLLEILDIKKEELVACGDGLNDVSMIKFAGLGVAMQNANPDVKKYAEYIAPTNDNDGVSDVLLKYFL